MARGATFAARVLVAALALVASSARVVAQPLVRTLAPFAIERANGEAFRNPFSGGLWQPRIGLLDADGDGRLDLFTLNPDGELRYHHNEGGAVFRRILPSAYDSLPVNNWFRFADLDGDGASEILTAGARSELMAIDNDGSDAAPLFRLPARVLRDVPGDIIYLQRETVPSLVDIDGDGDLDLFTGNTNGSITFYRNTGSRTASAFTFETATYKDILVISQIGAARRPGDPPASSSAEVASSRHGASVLDFADLDGDGDLDMLFGDYLTRKLLEFENFGTPQAAEFSMTRLDTAFRPNGDDVESEGFNQPMTGDLDGDGDLDAIISSLYPSDAPSLVYYENTGTRTAPVMRRRSIDLTSELDVGTFAAPAAIDDATHHGLLVGSASGRLTYLERSTGTPTSYRIAATLPLAGISQSAPSAGDLDADGSAEIAVGESNGAIVFFRFDNGALVRYGETLQVNRNASPTLVDLDGDGDLDILSGAENGRLHLFVNTGTPTAPQFVRGTPPAPFDSLDVGYDSAPRFFDIDGDGVQEAIVGGRTGGSSIRRDTLRFFERSGSGYVASVRFAPMAVARNPVALGLALPEGRFLLVGDLAGGIKAFRDTAQIGAVDVQSLAGGITIGADAGAIVVDAGTVRAVVVRIIDALGRRVLERPLAAGERRVRIGTGGLAAGTYLVEVAGAGARAAVVIPVVR